MAVQTETKRWGLSSPRVAHDPEWERYHPNLEEELQEVVAEMQRNEMLFNLETEPDLVEQRIYERQALQCRYRYLISEARRLGLHAFLANHG